ncbi:MAG: hypothetical protein ABSC05_34170 [Candidatus Solibacter sp.]|jgi:hypothetical protein
MQRPRQSAFVNPSPVPVHLRHPEFADGLTLEVELNQDRDLVADDPPIVRRLDHDDLWGHKLRGAAVRVLDMDLAAGQEADVGVHAKIGADDRLHVGGPAKPGRVDHALHAAGAGSRNINLGTADFPALAAGYGRDR